MHRSTQPYWLLLARRRVLNTPAKLVYTHFLSYACIYPRVNFNRYELLTLLIVKDLQRVNRYIFEKRDIIASPSATNLLSLETRGYCKIIRIHGLLALFCNHCATLKTLSVLAATEKKS